MSAPAPRPVVSRQPLPVEQVALRLNGALPRAKKPPTAAEVEVERSLWGKHPDPVQAWVEDAWFEVGHHFLRGLLAAVLGKKNPAPFVTKAEGAPGWGEVMALFQSPAPPAEKLATWGSLVDQFSASLLPPTTVQNQAAMWALRSSLLSQIADRVHAVTTPGAWNRFFHALPPAQRQQVEWAQAKGAQYVTNMRARAREAVMNALVESQQAGGNHHDLERVLHDRLGTLNRDWRRIAITETGMAVASGQLLTALASGGEWEAIWTAGPRACPFCKAQNGRVLRVVPDDFFKKDGSTMVWPSKTNVGRSASLHRRDGTRRGPDELWWPCIPAHPNCACVYTLRRILKSASAKRLDEKLRRAQAERFAAATR